MAENPVAIVSQIAREAKISLAQSKRILENNEHLDVGHIVIGNRLRKKGKVKFRKSHHKETLHGIDRIFAAVMNRSRSVLGF
jgi:MinD superfamily P-loop ATPase